MSESNMQKMQITYTPTTEEVLEAATRLFVSSLGYRSLTVAEFDRWLGAVKAQAVAEWLAERMAAFEKADLEDYEQEETE